MAKNTTSVLKPIPFTGTHSYSIRVLINWLYVTLLLLVLMAFANIAFKLNLSAETYWILSLVISINVYFFGFVGLIATNISQKGQASYPGWYWWLLPFIMYATLAWWFIIAFIGLMLFIESLFSSGRSSFSRPKYKMMFSPSKKDVERQKSKDFLEGGGKELFDAQQEEEEKLSRKYSLSQEDQDRLETLSIREKILRKIQNSPDALLEHILTDDEIEELMVMILESML
jgi:hypothetical protein